MLSKCCHSVFISAWESGGYEDSRELKWRNAIGNRPSTAHRDPFDYAQGRLFGRQQQKNQNLSTAEVPAAGGQAEGRGGSTTGRHAPPSVRARLGQDYLVSSVPQQNASRQNDC